MLGHFQLGARVTYLRVQSRVAVRQARRTRAQPPVPDAGGDTGWSAAQGPRATSPGAAGTVQGAAAGTVQGWVASCASGVLLLRLHRRPGRSVELPSGGFSGPEDTGARSSPRPEEKHGTRGPPPAPTRGAPLPRGSSDVLWTRVRSLSRPAVEKLPATYDLAGSRSSDAAGIRGAPGDLSPPHAGPGRLSPRRACSTHTRSLRSRSKSRPALTSHSA